MKLKQRQNRFNPIVNANSVVQHVIQIKNAIIKHVDVNVKVIISVRKIIVKVRARIFVRKSKS